MAAKLAAVGLLLVLTLMGLDFATSLTHFCPTTRSYSVWSCQREPRWCYNCYVGWYICHWACSCSFKTVIRIDSTSCCSGWRGTQCDIPICSTPCLNKGLCVKPNTCDCPVGSTGSICQLKTCSFLTDCYPGTCSRPNRSPVCTCPGLFHGNNCQLLRAGVSAPTCQGTLLASGNSLHTGLCGIEERKNHTTWAGKRDFDTVNFRWLARYDRETDLPERPAYLRSFLHGMTETFATMTLRGTDNSNLTTLTMFCYKKTTTGDPSESKDCNVNFPFPAGVTTGQELELRVGSRTGGYKTVRDENNLQNTRNTTITGIDTNRDVLVFKFDFVPPYHCYQTGECDASRVNPIIHGPDLLPTSNFTVAFAGWEDEDSGLQSAEVAVYHMSWHEEGYLLEDRKPILESVYDITSNDPLLSFNLPEAGMYSIIATITDWADNKAYARALMLYDDVSSLQTTGTPMQIQGGNRVADNDLWVNTTQGPIELSWTDRYRNDMQLAKHWLAPARPFQDAYPEGIDDIIGNRTFEEFPNQAGVANYSMALETGYNVPQVGRRRKREAPGEGEWQSLFLQDNMQITQNREDVDAFTLWLRAEDAVGHSVVEYFTIRVDSTAPSVNPSRTTFDENTGYGDLRYYSRLNVYTADIEGGIHTIEYDIVDVTSDQNPETVISSVHQGRLVQTTPAECLTSLDCFCTKFEECYESPQEVFVNNCWLRFHIGRRLKIEGQVFNRARLQTGFEYPLGVLTDLRGMNEFPAPEDVRLMENWGFGVRFSWRYNESCYEIMSVVFQVEGVSTSYNARHATVGRNTTEVIIEGLLPTHEYLLTAYIEYNNQKNGVFMQPGEEYILPFVTAHGPPPPKGLSTGGIVGIVIGVLLLILIILVVVFILLRIRAHKDPIPENIRTRARTIRSDIVNRFTHHPTASDDLDWERGAKLEATNRYTMHPSVNFVSRPALTGDEDDIYFYSAMETDPGASWKHSSDRFTLGKVLVHGKFADVHIGILEEKRERTTVAAKTLKQRHTADDALLMVAKMNFMAHGIEPHPNLVNFMGAVMARKTLLLEYCDESLKDWLKKHSNPTADDEDEMINFCTDVSRGLEHLHQQEIIHRRLGARNVLLRTVNGRRLAKLFGFGPMKGEQEGSEAMSSAKERVPIKWMAPEQLGLPKGETRAYNKATDVWSYGVTVWEIFSHGANPYSDRKSSEMKAALDSGYRLSRPAGCPDTMFSEIVDNCWVRDPSSRPTCEKIRQSLESHFHGMQLGEEYYSDDYLPQVGYIIRNHQGTESQLIYASTN